MSRIHILDWAQGYAERVFDEIVLNNAQQTIVRIAAIDAVRDAMREIPHGDTWVENAKELIKERIVDALPPMSSTKGAPVQSPTASEAARRQGRSGGLPNGYQGHL